MRGRLSGIIASIIRASTPDIMVETHLDSFVFSTERRILGIRAFLYISNADGKKRVISVGEEPEGDRRGIRVDLFSKRGESLEEYLSAFLRYGFARVVGRKAFFIPDVYFKGTTQVADKTGNTPNEVLERCARLAGAAEIYFDD